MHLATIDLTPIFIVLVWILTKAFALLLFVALLAVLRFSFRKRIKRMSPDDKGLLIKAATGASIGYLLIVFVPGVFEHINQGTLIGIASIVVVSYLPFAIASLQDPDNELHWDKQVMLEGVLDSLLLTFLLVFGFIAPILFWEAAGQIPALHGFHYLQVMLIAFFAMAVSGYIWAMLKIYGWMNGLGKENRLTFRHKKRQEFLLQLPDARKTGVWTAKNWQQLPKLALIEQEQLIEIFLQHIKELEHSDDIVIIIDDLNYNLRFLSLYRSKIYACAFNLAFLYPQKSRQKALSDSLKYLQKSLTRISLYGDERVAEYDELCKFFLQQCQKVLEDKNVHAITFTVKITEVFFQTLQVDKPINIARSDFPSSWWVTLDRLQPAGDVCAKTWFKSYQEWIEGNCRSTMVQDGILNSPAAWKITIALFPKIHIVSWFYLFHIQELFSEIDGQKIQIMIDTIVKNENGMTSIEKRSDSIVFTGSGSFTKHTERMNLCSLDALKETIGIYKLFNQNYFRNEQQFDKCLEVIKSVKTNYRSEYGSGDTLRLEALDSFLRILKNNA